MYFSYCRNFNVNIELLSELNQYLLNKYSIYIANTYIVDIYVAFTYNSNIMKPKNIHPEIENTVDLPKKSKSIRLIAANIKHFRTQLGISQEYLAELADLHKNYVGQLERREVNISVISLENIAKALKVEVKDLLIKQPGLTYK